MAGLGGTQPTNAFNPVPTQQAVLVVNCHNAFESVESCFTEEFPSVQAIPEKSWSSVFFALSVSPGFVLAKVAWNTNEGPISVDIQCHAEGARKSAFVIVALTSSISMVILLHVVD